MLYAVICLISLGLLTWQFNTQLYSMGERTPTHTNTHTHPHQHTPTHIHTLHLCIDVKIIDQLPVSHLKNRRWLKLRVMLIHAHKQAHAHSNWRVGVEIAASVCLSCLYVYWHVLHHLCGWTVSDCYFGHDPVLLFIMFSLNMISLTVGDHFGSEGFGESVLTNYSMPKPPATNYTHGFKGEYLRIDILRS